MSCRLGFGPFGLIFFGHLLENVFTYSWLATFNWIKAKGFVQFFKKMNPGERSLCAWFGDIRLIGMYFLEDSSHMDFIFTIFLNFPIFCIFPIVPIFPYRNKQVYMGLSYRSLNRANCQLICLLVNLFVSLFVCLWFLHLLRCWHI